MGRSVSPTDLAQKAFVRGFGDDVDEDALRHTFSKFGNVVDVHIAKDRETNTSRGFAFITFNNSTECSKACNSMDGKELHGRTLQVELASHFNKGGGRGGFRGARGGGSFRGRRSVSPPARRGGGSFRGSWRGGSGRGEYRGFRSRPSDSEERYRGGFERDPPPARDYGRYESSYEYRGEYRGRAERDFPESRDYSYRGRDYPERDYGPVPRGRDYPGGYSPPREYARDYPPSSRDYPPYGGRDYPPSRNDREFDVPPRRFASRDYLDDYPSGGASYDSRPPRRDYDGPPRDFGSSGRFENYGSGGGRGGFKGGRGTFSQRGSRDDYGRGMPQRRMSPRNDDRIGMRKGARSPDGPPPKKMKSNEPLRRSPRGGGARRF